MSGDRISQRVVELLHEGTVIPAHPLALDSRRKLNETRQRGLTQYYLACGVGGVAVGVHTTQFEIRHPHINLYAPVLEIAAEEIEIAALNRPFIKVAGIVGPTEQALAEAETAVKFGYDLGLVGMGGLTEWSEMQILERVRAIGEIIPIFGFYLQPSVGGRIFSYDFWLEFSRIKDVHAIKVAAFNRYHTLDVVRAVCHSGRHADISLYTGNDDNIVADLLTTYRFPHEGRVIEKGFVGGLLGHWAVWTRKAVELLDQVKRCKANGMAGIEDLLITGVEVTDMNAAIFDPANNFHGCISGIHEVLQRQGLLDGRVCLNPDEDLSPGQSDEITRVCKLYPHLTDDDFVKKFLQQKVPRVG